MSGPRRCARDDLGCAEVAPSYNRRAAGAGWFFTRPDHPDGAQAFCPAHVPGWVASWRARQEIRVTRRELPRAASCCDCAWAREAAGTGDEDRLVLLEQVREHVRLRRHRVLEVRASQTVHEPALEAAASDG